MNYDEDHIILGGGGLYPKTIWTFPITNVCPASNCKKMFKERDLLIHHYRKQHSKYYVLCEECEIPIYARTFVEHEKSNKHRIARANKKVKTLISNISFQCKLNEVFYFKRPKSIRSAE